MSGRTFRVFVSSTFSDLKEERNALARYVYPRLRSLCESRGFKFQAVDLRWGVRDEAAVDQQTMRICLDEIARCQELSPKPNFIVLLGDRYGWCPLPSEISVDEMKLLVRGMTKQDRKLVLHHGTSTVPNGAARAIGWYRRDRNADPPEYVLQPRRDAFKDNDVWGPIERRLHDALAGAATAAGIGETELLKYRASAVELEILKGVVEAKDAHEHVFGFFREITNRADVENALPKTGTEKKKLRDDFHAKTEHAEKTGKAKPAQPPALAAADLIDAPDPLDENAPLVWDKAAWAAQQRLKATLQAEPPHGLGKANVWPYRARWTNGGLDLDRSGVLRDLPEGTTPQLVDADSQDVGIRAAAWKQHSHVIAKAASAPLPETINLCEAVWQRLSRVIALQMDALDNAQGDPLEVEMQAHTEFAKKRATVFRGRAVPLQQIAAYLGAGAARPLVVCGESGSGKSALMARAIELARIAHPDAVIVTRFVGAAPGASEARPLLRSVCLELTRAFGDEAKALPDVPDAYDKLVNDFPTRLKLASPKRPVFLFIDALDQLSDSNNGRKLGWLPQALPPNVRVVVSTLPDDKYHCFAALKDRTQSEDFVQDLVRVAPMTADEGEAVLQAWLAGLPKPRKLTGEQPALVLTTFQRQGLPLYLKLAFEEARRWRSYDGVPKTGLAPDVPGIIRAMFARLIGQHGEPVVSRALGFLAATRHGLSDDEMLALLWSDEEVKDDFNRRKHHELPEGEAALPPVVWSRLYFDVEPYLAHRDVLGVGLLAFYHRQLAEVTTEVCLVAEGREAGVHGQLADYFADRWEGGDKHALVELVEQLLEASRSEVRKLRERRLREAQSVCRNARFLRLRCEVLGPYAVEQELVTTADWLEEHDGESSAIKQGAVALRQTADAVGQEAHWLVRIGEAGLPICFDDIVYNRLLCNGVGKAEIADTVRGLELRLPLLHPVRMGNAERVLAGHTKAVEACALSADGKRALSAGLDGETLRVWDTASGETLQVLKGYWWGKACALSADGKLALSARLDNNTLRVWDTASGETLKVLEGHTGGVLVCALSADGKCALSAGSRDKTLRVWDTTSGETLKVLEGHRDYVTACALSADGKLALSGSDDRTLRVWDTVTGETPKVLEGHTGGIAACALSADGKLALSGSHDETLRVWDTATAGTLKVLNGHTRYVYACALSADGKRALSGSHDNTLRVWDTASGETLKVLEGHTDGVKACALSADGKRALSGSHDKTLRVWNTASGETPKMLEGLTRDVTACALSADGKRALSGSGKTLRVWDTVTGETLKVLVLEGYWHEVYAAHLSADGKLALSGSDDKTLRVWDTATGETLKVLAGHTHSVNPCALSADGKRALSGSRDKTLRVWDTASGEMLKVLDGHTRDVTACALSADGKRALSGDKILRVWDTASGETLKVLEAHTSYVHACALSADGKLALSGSEDNTLRVWDATGEAPKMLEGHRDYVTACALSADGKRALSGSRDKTLHVWNTASGETLQVLEGHTDGVTACALSADGKLALSSGSRDQTLRVWDTASGETLQVLEGHTHSVGTCALSADGKRALSGSHDKTLRVWNTASGETLKVLEGHTHSVGTCALSADGKRALSGSDDKTLRVWDTASGETLQVLEGHTHSAGTCALSADGKRALSGSDDNNLRVWNTASGETLKVLEGHTGSVYACALSADGKLALSGSGDTTVRVWDTVSGETLMVIEGLTNLVLACALSADGKRALSGSGQTLRVWDTATAGTLKVLRGHTGTVYACALSADGKFALSGSYDNTLRVWELEHGTCLQVVAGVAMFHRVILSDTVVAAGDAARNLWLLASPLGSIAQPSLR